MNGSKLDSGLEHGAKIQKHNYKTLLVVFYLQFFRQLGAAITPLLGAALAARQQ